ncbi:hypothetical protein DID75_04395 [Candidatus Marinamargulisbacteria bacterium SCGC AG-410-N11]|nr:hypothetical protein DID75_04395 [Candidatus Marinamargulisbacteria bacterium SCGC AG-410-N11]
MNTVNHLLRSNQSLGFQFFNGMVRPVAQQKSNQVLNSLNRLSLGSSIRHRSIITRQKADMRQAFEFMWNLYGFSDMTPPPADPKTISVVPLSQLLGCTNEGGAAPTQTEEVDQYQNQIQQQLTVGDHLSDYLSYDSLPNDRLEIGGQYSRLSNILIGQSKENQSHYWLFKFVDLEECIREFTGPCLATICEERTMVLKHMMMYVTHQQKLKVLNPFKPKELVAAVKERPVFVARQFALNSITLNDYGDVTDHILSLTRPIPINTFIRHYVVLHWIMGDADFNNPGNWLFENRLFAKQGKTCTSIDYGQILQNEPGQSGYIRGTVPDRQYISRTFEGGPDYFFERQVADGFNPMLRIPYTRFYNENQRAGLSNKEAREQTIQDMKSIVLRSGDQKRLAYKLDAISVFLNQIGLTIHDDHLAGLKRLGERQPLTLYEVVTGLRG